jgi:hypothetical protein
MVDPNKPEVLVRLQGWTIAEVGGDVLIPLEETRILKRRRLR